MEVKGLPQVEPGDETSYVIQRLAPGEALNFAGPRGIFKKDSPSLTI